MFETSIGNYRCPKDHLPLTLEEAVKTGNDVRAGGLVSKQGQRYPIEAGIPDFTYPELLNAATSETKAEYEYTAEQIYDDAVDWQFASMYENEDAVRESMVDLLELKPSQTVLEVGCGTGRDSFRLARRLGKDGALFMQDLSPNMVRVCRKKMEEMHEAEPFDCRLEYSIGNVPYLPFSDGFFDAVFHFGGFNQFGNLRKSADEFARITKPGGHILYGDESVAPWLRGTEFERIVTTNNSLFESEVPLGSIPECARDVSVQWIMANCFYLVHFRKGDGIPPLNLDLPHKGWRGGTLRTRYFGILEGVKPETRDMVRDAAAAAGLSVHEWLDDLVRDGAQSTIDEAAKKGGRSE